MVGHTPPLVLQPPQVVIEGHVVDPCTIVAPLTITHGRSDVSSQPSAPSCTFVMLGLPGPLRLGMALDVVHRSDRLDVWSDVWSDEWGGDPTPVADVWSDIWSDVWADSVGVDQVRFRGRISDMSVEREGSTITTAIVATGLSAGLGSRIGDEPWPEQSEQKRVGRIASLLPDVDVAYVGDSSGYSGTVVRLDVDSRSALDVLTTLASQTGSVLVEDVDGRVLYQSQAWRDAIRPPALMIDEYAIEDRTAWEAAEVVNSVHVAYGYAPDVPDPSGGGTTTKGPRPSVKDRESASVQVYGEHRVEVDSAWRDGSDASRLAARIVHVRAWEVWQAPQVMVPAHLLPSLEAWRAVVALVRVGARVTLRFVTPDPSPAGGVGDWVVEGWVETWDRLEEAGGGSRLEHWLQLAVSPAGPWVTDVARTMAHVSADYVPDHPEGPMVHVVASWQVTRPRIIAPMPPDGPWPELRVLVGGVLVARSPAPAGVDAWVPVGASMRGRIVGVVAQGTHLPGFQPCWASASVFVPSV